MGEPEEDLEQFSVPIDWQSKDLTVGDRVGFLVCNSGEACVFQNGEEVARAKAEEQMVPTDESLYAVIDLLGNTSGIELLQDVQPPVHFDSRLISKNVALSNGDRTAKHDDHGGEEVCGVCFCAVPAPFFGEGVYFEVKVEAVQQGCDDGLVIGVTRELPKQEGFEPPEVADVIKDSWSAGYDGQAHASDKGEMVPISWKPSELKQGDRVGLLIKKGNGDALVVVNGKPVVELPWPIPVDRPLYPFIDLLGNTISVSLVLNAKPPGGSEIAKSGWNKSPVTFDRRRVSGNVELSKENKVATYTNPDPEEGKGVLFGNMAVVRYGYAVGYFEVAVTEIRTGCCDGLTLGVTVQRPDRSAEPAMFVDEVDHSWTYGYDGQCIVVPPAEPTHKEAVSFRKNVSTYKVARFNRSVFGDLKPKTDAELDAEDEEDADDDDGKQVAASRRGTAAVKGMGKAGYKD